MIGSKRRTRIWPKQRKRTLNIQSQGTPSPKPGQHWGVLGGAFDPIHNGHLNLARQIQSQFGLEGVLFVPAANPKHRDSLILSAFEDRLAMTRLGIEAEQAFVVESLEQDLNLSGYTIDTLQALRQKYPNVTFELIIGADQAQVLDTWNRPDAILQISKVLVGARPGYPIHIPESLDRSRISIVSIDVVDMSSSEIRRKVEVGISESDLARLVPPPVATYIVKHKLYLS